MLILFISLHSLALCRSGFHFNIFQHNTDFLNVLLTMGASGQTRSVSGTCLPQIGRFFLSLAGPGSILHSYLLCSVPGLYLTLYLFLPRFCVSDLGLVLSLALNWSCVHCLMGNTSKFHSCTKFPKVSYMLLVWNFLPSQYFLEEWGTAEELTF